MVATAEIISIGNELLLGDVLDTNTHWLCRQITGLGGRVRRAAMVPDDPQAIAGALGAALQRHPHLVVMTGGLGPTADDLTLASLAEALDRPLELSEQALAMVRETYAQLADRGLVQDRAMTDARRKMALLPQGGEPLHNPVGAAPGVLLTVGDTVCVSLPGVPGELKSIFGETLRGVWADLFGNGSFAERILVTDCGDESSLAPVVNDVAADHPEVYVKSRAQLYGEDVLLRITLSLSGDDSVTMVSALDAVDRDLTMGLAALGISVLERMDGR